MPKTFEIYLHRVGRTGAGRDGTSITFVGESSQERAIVKSAIVNGKGVAKTVDWKQAEETNKLLESKESVIDEVLEEEKGKGVASCRNGTHQGIQPYQTRTIHSRPKELGLKVKSWNSSLNMVRK